MTDRKGATAPGFHTNTTAYDFCSRCNGDGWIEAGQWPCPECRGSGMVELDDYDESTELTDEYDERESGDG